MCAVLHCDARPAGGTGSAQHGVTQCVLHEPDTWTRYIWTVQQGQKHKADKYAKQRINNPSGFWQKKPQYNQQTNTLRIIMENLAMMEETAAMCRDGFIYFMNQ